MRRAGGAYGGKLTRSLPIVCLAAVAARKTNRNVKLVLEIYHDQQTNAGRAEFQSNYQVRPLKFPNHEREEGIANMFDNASYTCLLCKQVGYESSGKITALDINAYGGAGTTMEAIIDTCQEFTSSSDCCYNIPNFRVQATPCSMNRPPMTALRAPGHVQASLLAETVIDAVAADLGMDPQQVREVNFYTARTYVLEDAYRYGWLHGSAFSSRWCLFLFDDLGVLRHTIKRSSRLLFLTFGMRCRRRCVAVRIVLGFARLSFFLFLFEGAFVVHGSRHQLLIVRKILQLSMPPTSGASEPWFACPSNTEWEDSLPTRWSMLKLMAVSQFRTLLRKLVRVFIPVLLKSQRMSLSTGLLFLILVLETMS